MIIKQTQFPKDATLTNKDAWRRFWDDYGLGRENNSGAQFPSEAITSRDGILTIPFNKGDWGGAGWQNTGAIIYNSKPYHKGKSIYAEFECKFGKDFDWGNKGDRYRGGKFGFSFTVGDVGVGRKPSPGNFQATTMWRDGGQMDFYFYNYTQSGAWPDKILYTTVERETWYKFGMNIVLNDPGKENGYVQIYIDDKLVYERKELKLSDSSDGKELFKSAFGNFFGGNSDAWKSRTKSDIQYKYIKIYDSMPEGEVPEPEPEPTPEPDPAKREIIVFRGYDIQKLNSGVDWVQAVFDLPEWKMQAHEKGVRLTVDAGVGPFDAEIRAELRESNIDTYPEEGTSQIYHSRFHILELPKLYAPLAVFQRFNRDNDGPDIELELTGSEQFSDAVPNELQVVAFGKRIRLPGKFLKEINDLKVAIYNSSKGYYKVSLNGETLAEGEADTRPSKDGTWTQFGIYPHGWQDEALRNKQVESDYDVVSGVWEFYSKESEEGKIDFSEVSTMDYNENEPIPEPEPLPGPDPLPEPLPSPVGSGDYDLEIDCGSESDMYVEGGTAYPVPENLGGKMATERYGEFTYTIPLDPGKHKVSLLFASQFSGASEAGQRVFDVLANGQELLSDFDIVAIAGHMKPYVHTFEIVISSNLVLDFIKNIQNPMINGIMISKISDSGDSIEELKDKIKELEDDLEVVAKERDELLEQAEDYDNAFSDIKKIIEGF